MPVAFTTIPDSDIDPESPITVGLMTAIRDNITACRRTLFSDTVMVGNVGAGEDDLMSYTMPANTMDTNGQSLKITVWGQNIAAKVVVAKMHFGGDFISFLSAGPVYWHGEFTILRTGAAAQDETGFVVHETVLGTDSLIRIMQKTPVEDLTAAVVIKVTGENTTDATNDAIVQHGMIVEFIP